MVQPAPIEVSGPRLRALLDTTLAALSPRLHQVGQGGAACAALAEVYDRALAERFTAAAAGAELALVATGGWARRELAPYSDIDFIVLHDGDEAAAKRVCDRLLYPLWDEKLAIGHAVREPRAAARLARDDLATATALLDARHIAGDRRLTTELVRATLAALAPGGNPNDLIAALAAEKQARHARFGATLYLLEPNLKQGIGGLRDLATALWCAQVRWQPPRPGDAAPEGGADALIGNLVTMGHLTGRQGQVLLGARDFQLRIRALVQLTAKRRFDQLTFEIQEAIAPALYPDAHAHDGERAGGRARGRGADARLLPARARRGPGRRPAARERAGPGAAAAADRAGRRLLHHVQRRAGDPRSAAVRRAPGRDGADVPGRGRRAPGRLRPHPRARRRGDRARSRAARARPARRPAVPRRADRSARRRAAVRARGHEPARRAVGDDARVGAVRRPRPARPLPRLHRRPAPALRAGDAEAAGARRARGRAPDRGRAVARRAAAGPAAARHAAPRRRQAAGQGPRREGRGGRRRRGAPARDGRGRRRARPSSWSAST